MTTTQIVTLTVPAILTVLLNIIFYLFIKSHADKKIEQNKIVYGGLFQEKIKIYRALLEKKQTLKMSMLQFKGTSSRVDLDKIESELNDFMYFGVINQAFWSIRMMNEITKLNQEFYKFYNTFREFIEEKSQLVDGPDRKILEESFQPLSEILIHEDNIQKHFGRIVVEMREDLQINIFNKSS